MTITATCFATGLLIRGASTLQVFASTPGALYFCDPRDGAAPCLTTESGYTEWRGSVSLTCGDSVLLPVGSYRIVATDYCGESRGLVAREVVWAGPLDLNCDGGGGDDADIEALWNCLAGRCGDHADADYDRDFDVGTDADLALFYSLLAGSAQP